MLRRTMEPDGSVQHQSATVEQEAEAAGGNGSPAGAAGLAAMPIRGREKPIIELREFARSTAALARRAPDLRAVWFDGRLDPAFREEIMVAVAAANACRQCSFAHREWALAEGLPEDELAELEGMQVESFDARRWAAVAWAQAATRSRFAEVPDVIDVNFQQQFSAQERSDIELVARTMDWTNRISNTAEAAWSRVHSSPVAESGAGRELAAVLIYAAVTPLVLVILSVKQRRSPISLIAGIKPFFRQFEVPDH